MFNHTWIIHCTWFPSRGSGAQLMWLWLSLSSNRRREELMELSTTNGHINIDYIFINPVFFPCGASSVCVFDSGVNGSSGLCLGFCILVHVGLPPVIFLMYFGWPVNMCEHTHIHKNISPCFAGCSSKSFKLYSPKEPPNGSTFPPFHPGTMLDRDVGWVSDL